MRLNKIIIIVLIISILFVLGCAPKQKGSVTGYIGGVNGLKASFADSEPPEKVLDANNEQFRITVVLRNEGERDIAPGGVKTTVTGINPVSFQIKDSTQKNENDITGSKREQDKLVPGGQDEISYSASYKDDEPTDVPFNIGVNVCYKYGTDAVANLCLRKQASARSSEKDVCQIYADKTISNSGAPVQITALSERPAGLNKVKVIFNIENKGKGIVYSKDAFASNPCIPEKEKDRENMINVRVSTNADAAIKCGKLEDRGEGAVRLVEGKTIVTCDLDTSRLAETTFENPLKITLDYMYKEDLNKQVIVQNAV